MICIHWLAFSVKKQYVQVIVPISQVEEIDQIYGNSSILYNFYILYTSDFHHARTVGLYTYVVRQN